MATKCQLNRKVKFGMPFDTEEMPLQGVEHHNFEGIGNVCFSSHAPTLSTLGCLNKAFERAGTFTGVNGCFMFILLILLGRASLDTLTCVPVWR